MYIGHRLGLYQTLAEAGPITSGKLAQRTGYVERYVREWLFAQAAGGYLDYNAATQRFSLSPEYAAVLVDRDSPAYLMPFTQFGPSITSALPALLEAFRRGGGVPFESYGQDCIEAIAFGNRPMYINDLSDKWIPALPDVAARLRRGGRVADIGCGAGWSSIYIAKGYPHVYVDGVDVDESSIEQARDNAAKEGVSDRVTFHCTAVEKAALEGRYDLVTAFECLHDMPYPVEALKRMRELVRPDGTVLSQMRRPATRWKRTATFWGISSTTVACCTACPRQWSSPALRAQARPSALLPCAGMRSRPASPGLRCWISRPCSSGSTG